jgi:hypothetical protein
MVDQTFHGVGLARTRSHAVGGLRRESHKAALRQCSDGVTDGIRLRPPPIDHFRHQHSTSSDVSWAEAQVGHVSNEP